MFSSWKTWVKIGQPDIEATASKSSGDLRQQPSGYLNVSHQYRAAVGTESYDEFRSKLHDVIAHSHEENGETSDNSQPRYSRFVAELLSPDQESVNAILQQTILLTRPEFGKMVSGYFSNGEYVYRLCSRLLDSIHRARDSYSKIRTIIELAPTAGDFSEEQFHWIVKEFHLFMEFENPFSHPDSEALQSVRDCFQHLFQQFELYRDQVHRKLKLINKFNKVFSLCLQKLQCESIILLRKRSAQLDVATKGTYILTRHLDTMIRLVPRLYNEVDNNKVLIGFCQQREDDKYFIQEVVKQLRKNYLCFAKTLDEIEDYVYLCLININRTRKQLVQEIRMQQQEV